MKRYLETLFRQKELFLIPLLATPLIALLVVLSLGKSYEVPTVLWTEPSRFLDTAINSQLAVNEREGQAIQEWLSTEAFRRDVMERSGLTAAIQRGEWPSPSPLGAQLDNLGLTRVPGLGGALRSAGLTPPGNTQEAMAQGMTMVQNTITVTPEGNNLILLAYNGRDPRLGTRMLEEVILLYRDKTLQNRTQAARTGVDFYTRQAQTQKARMQGASDNLQIFLENNSTPLPGQPRPAAQEAELDNLRNAYLLEQALYEDALRKLEEVRVESEATISNRDLSFQVVDPPQEPATTGMGKGTIALTLVLGLLLGAVVGSLPIILATWLDGAVRSREDVEQVAGAPVIAQAPVMRLDRRRPDLLRRALASTTVALI